MIQKLRRQLTTLFLGLTMLAFTAVLGILAGNRVADIRRSEELFLSNVAASIVEEFPEPSVQKRYAEKYGICILSEEGSRIVPEGMPIEALLAQRNARSALSMLESDKNGRQISQALYSLFVGADSFYALELAVSSKTEGIRCYQIFAPRESLGHILQRHCGAFPFLWLGMLVTLFFISRFLIQKALAPVQSAMKSQREFIAAASHELKAPLAVIQANAETAQEHPEEAGKQLTIISAQCSHMGKLVESLLELEARDAGHWTMHTVPTDVDSLLIAVWESFREPVARQNMELYLELGDTEFPQLQADPDRLKQALGILLDNAWAYGVSPKGIRLRAELRKGHVVFYVADHGPGIPDAEKEKVFRRFYRSDPSRTERNHFGLGLSIAQEIAAAHRGKLHLSDTTGGGCTAEMEIPAK